MEKAFGWIRHLARFRYQTPPLHVQVKIWWVLMCIPHRQASCLATYAWQEAWLHIISHHTLLPVQREPKPDCSCCNPSASGVHENPRAWGSWQLWSPRLEVLPGPRVISCWVWESPQLWDSHPQLAWCRPADGALSPDEASSHRVDPATCTN